MSVFSAILGAVVAIALVPMAVGQLRHKDIDPCNFFIIEASLSGPNVLSAVLRNQHEIDYLSRAFGAKGGLERLLSRALHDIASDVAKQEGIVFCYQMSYLNIVFPDEFDKFFEDAARSIVNTS